MSDNAPLKDKAARGKYELNARERESANVPLITAKSQPLPLVLAKATIETGSKDIGKSSDCSMVLRLTELLKCPQGAISSLCDCLKKRAKILKFPCDLVQVRHAKT